MFAATTLVAGPYAILRGGTGLAAALWRARLIIAAGMGFGISSSPRGGGPGHSPISTNTPPSIEEVGRMITGKSGSGKSQPRGPKGTLIKCPRGYHWDKKTGRCLKNRKKY